MLDRMSPGPDLDESRPSRKTSNHQNQRKLSIFTARFRNALKKSVEGIIEAGRVLIEAKDELEHGQFIDWVVRELRFGTRKDGSRPADLRKAQILMFLARNEVISNANHWYAFPPSWRTLWELTQIRPKQRLLELIATGAVNSGMTREEAVALRLKTSQKPLADAETETRNRRVAGSLYYLGRWRWRSCPYSRPKGRKRCSAGRGN